jgi:tRNA threonylcarbamoyladenosine biosynthesis protein TsaE
MEAIMELELKLNTLADTETLARIFANILEPGILVCLYGSIGTGKTTFVKYCGAQLGIEEEITSPSFVIINEYVSGNFPLYHFDLYRLEKEGVKSILSELEEYSSDPAAITFVEWAEFSENNLLVDRLEIHFSYEEDFSDKRHIKIIAEGKKPQRLLSKLDEHYVNCKL